MRDELLNREVFDTSLLEARMLIERWRQHYNRVGPHSSLGSRPPAPRAIEPLPLDSTTPLGNGWVWNPDLTCGTIPVGAGQRTRPFPAAISSWRLPRPRFGKIPRVWRAFAYNITINDTGSSWNGERRKRRKKKRMQNRSAGD